MTAQKDIIIDAIEGDNATIDKSSHIQNVLPTNITDALSTVEEEDRDEMERTIVDLQQQIASKTPDEGLIKQLLRKIRDVAPDILEIVTTTFSNPIAGIGLTLSKILDHE